MQVMVTWLLAHLEEYHTGHLLYSNGWLGVLEANYSLAMLSFLSFLMGEQVGSWGLWRGEGGVPRFIHALEVLGHSRAGYGHGDFMTRPPPPSHHAIACRRGARPFQLCSRSCRSTCLGRLVGACCRSTFLLHARPACSAPAFNFI